MKASAQNTSPAWRLSPCVHLAVVDDDLVFLDVVSDRYLCLRAAASLLEGEAAAGLWRMAEELARELRAGGLIEPAGAATEVGARPPAHPNASVVPDAGEPIQLGDIPEMLGCAADLFLRYRARSLAQVITTVRRSRARRGAAAALPLESLVSRFHRWLPYAPAPTKCLVRSFMLLRLLHRHGHDAAWVFGVTTWPFRAHCWVQSGDTVLDDDHENVAGFVPIMVV